MSWTSFFYLLGCGLAAWLAYRAIKHKPESFSTQAFFRTSQTLVWLALGLILLVTLCVWMLKQG